MEMMFTAFWRIALGLESIFLVMGTIYAISLGPPTWALAIMLTLAWCVLFVAWIKYWRMENLLRIPQMMVLL